MKTAEELFHKYIDDGMFYDEFIEAITEHDKEIIKLINEMIRQCAKRRTDIAIEKAVFSDDPDWLCEVGYKIALKELKNKLKE